ncbi:MAG: hypothetical protein HY018_07125 [Hydrogenophilales bacterium]|nr:hypothetical protein [Hydrogenophilales bacterium]
MENWIGLTVAQVLALCGTPFSDARMVDEPPGKLRAVEVGCHQGDRTVRMVLQLEYRPELFSADRAWDEKLVGRQKVIAVRGPADGGH